jgi:hypothetical protein
MGRLWRARNVSVEDVDRVVLDGRGFEEHHGAVGLAGVRRFQPWKAA